MQHTTDLAHKLVDAGYVTVVPYFFCRFTGDRQSLARGESRVELCDAEVVQDVDAIVTYLRTLPEVDDSRIAMIGVCQTGRQPVLISAYRDYLAGIVVMYGAIYNADWESQGLRPEPIDTLLEKLSCPIQGIFGELDNLVPFDNILRMCNVLTTARKSFDIRVYAEAPHGFLNDTMPGRYRNAQTQAAGARFSIPGRCLQQGVEQRARHLASGERYLDPLRFQQEQTLGVGGSSLCFLVVF